MSEEDIRLDQTKKVFKVLADLIQNKETCSYRYLIYDLLNFDGYYTTLIDGMTITNYLVECEDLQQRINKAQAIIKDYFTNGLEDTVDMLNAISDALRGDE